MKSVSKRLNMLLFLGFLRGRFRVCSTEHLCLMLCKSEFFTSSSSLPFSSFKTSLFSSSWTALVSSPKPAQHHCHVIQHYSYKSG